MTSQGTQHPKGDRMNSHLSRAKDYIAKGDDYYGKAADEIVAWLAEDPARTQAQAAREMGIGRLTVSRAIRARTTGEPIDWGSGSNKREEVASKVLSNPAQRRQTLKSLPPNEIEAVIQEAHGVVMDRLHAKQAEHDAAPKAPTVGDLMGGEKWDPGESWADTLIMRVNNNARALGRHVRQWGVVINALGEDTAFEYLQEAEREIAEVRVALQERIRDRGRAEV